MTRIIHNTELSIPLDFASRATQTRSAMFSAKNRIGTKIIIPPHVPQAAHPAASSAAPGRRCCAQAAGHSTQRLSQRTSHRIRRTLSRHGDRLLPRFLITLCVLPQVISLTAVQHQLPARQYDTVPPAYWKVTVIQLSTLKVKIFLPPLTEAKP